MSLTTGAVVPRTSFRPLVRAGVLSGVAAAIAATVIAALARAGDVPLKIDGERVPTAGFAQLTLLGAALGVLLAAVIRRRHRFVGVALAATALSLVPSLALPDHAATKSVLVLTHLVAAAIVVPALARQLPADTDRSPR
jgi:Family of unknown function (DUF6069)